MVELKISIPQKHATSYAMAAVVQHLKVTGQPVQLEVNSGTEITIEQQNRKCALEQPHASRYIVRSFPGCLLYGKNAIQSTLVDMWVDFTQEKLTTTDFKVLSGAYTTLNQHLKMRSYLVGYDLTSADLYAWGCLKASNIWTRMLKNKSEEHTHIIRWFQFISNQPACQSAVTLLQKTASTNSNKTTKESVNSNGFGLELPGAEKGKVVTRFPPEPSGYLHIGHTKAAFLNQYFAKENEGKLIVRFDDTNPSKEKMEFEESIIEDLRMLGIHGDILTWTSDHFDTLYKYALTMIENGLAYVDDTEKEQMRKERMDGIASKCRNQTVEENLRRFKEMETATEFGQKCCLRAKMSVDAKNKALRDPVMYRCNVLPHNRTGDKWKMYPTYDFACPVVDSIEGVTHALRTNEYRDRNDQYYWFLEKLGLRKPLIWDYSRVNFIYTLLSKRKLQWFVDKGLVTGWDDPRFPTVRGILRRGLTLDSLKRFILSQGASRSQMLLEWDKIWATNKQTIDPVAPRFVGLNKKDLRTVILTDGPEEAYAKDVPKHKKNADIGTKKLWFSKKVFLDADDGKGLVENEEVTLMDWGNVIITNVPKEGPIEAKLHLEGDFKKTKKKLTWLADVSHLTPLTLIDYDFLITKKKLEEEDSVEDCINPVTEYRVEAVGDVNLRELKKGDIIQLERRGYYICDAAVTTDHPSLDLILIPDGRASSSALKTPPVTGR